MISAWNYYVKLLNDGSFKYCPEQNRIESSRTARINCDGPSCCFLLNIYPWIIRLRCENREERRSISSRTTAMAVPQTVLVRKGTT